MKRLLIRLTFIVFWVALVVVLTVGAALVCTVKLLNPERLTPLVTRLAEKNLDADVTLGRAVLDFNPAFPVLRLRLDSLDIVSRLRRPAARRALGAARLRRLAVQARVV